MVNRLLVIADEYTDWQPRELGFADHVHFLPPAAGVSVADVAASDVVMVFSIRDGNQGLQLGGTLAQALHEGECVVVIAYPTALDAGRAAVFERLGLPSGYATGGNPSTVEARSQAFSAYLRQHGLSRVGWFDLPDNAAVLGDIETGTPRGRAVAAFKADVGTGCLVVLPYHVAHYGASHEDLIARILSGIESSRSADSAELPPYLAELRLPGEPELSGETDRREEQLALLRERADELAGLRLLLGPLRGAALESLVIAALNIVMAGTSFRARDEEERFTEDFWIYDGSERVAVAEVKGVNTGARREYVNQVDDHREALGFSPDEMPGLLVLNLHRGDKDLRRKVEEPIHADIQRHLKRQNVLLLRTADLYGLVRRSRDPGDAAHLLCGALKCGGGWLEVADSVDLRTGT